MILQYEEQSFSKLDWDCALRECRSQSKAVIFIISYQCYIVPAKWFMTADSELGLMADVGFAVFLYFIPR